MLHSEDLGPANGPEIQKEIQNAKSGICQRLLSFAKRHPIVTTATLSALGSAAFFPLRVVIPTAISSVLLQDRLADASADIWRKEAISDGKSSMFKYKFDRYGDAIIGAGLFAAVLYGGFWKGPTLFAEWTHKALQAQINTIDDHGCLELNHPYKMTVGGTNYTVVVTSAENQQKFLPDGTTEVTHTFEAEATFDMPASFWSDKSGTEPITRRVHMAPVREGEFKAGHRSPECAQLGLG
ncbi:MAG: hypothetical protein SFW62_05050 [Alphaproteobacteria bacterium]|nr:hypothetical protein [Alphaproteobacteria bacterium]